MNIKRISATKSLAISLVFGAAVVTAGGLADALGSWASDAPSASTGTVQIVAASAGLDDPGPWGAPAGGTQEDPGPWGAPAGGTQEDPGPWGAPAGTALEDPGPWGAAQQDPGPWG